ASSKEEALAAFRSIRHDLVIADVRLGEGIGEASGLDVLREVRRLSPDCKVVVITAHGNVDMAVEAMKLGAYDFVTKPVELEKMLKTAKNALNAGTLERRLAYHDDRGRRELNAVRIPGLSPAMTALEREVEIVAVQPVPVALIAGETGTGKALIARR